MSNLSKKFAFKDFLRYNYKIINNKVVIKISRKKLETIKKKLKLIKYNLDMEKISFNQAFCSIMTYMYSYKYANNIRIKNLIARYFYYEK